MSEEKISILIPAYNEGNNIGMAIERLETALPNAEVIVVDDGSMDQTLAKAKSYENGSVKVFSLPHRGKGSAVKKAIREASGDVMVQIDADLQFSSQELLRLVNPILSGQADIVFASRFLDLSIVEKGSVSIIKRLASFVMAGIISIVCRQRYTDVFAGFKAWKADVIRDINIEENGFAYEAEIAIKAKRLGYFVAEVPTAYKRRLADRSKIRIAYHTFTVFWRVIKLIFVTRVNDGAN